MAKLGIEVCPIMRVCSINFKNVYNCFTEENMKCDIHLKLWNNGIEEITKSMRDVFKKSVGSHNLCFTNYYIIHFWLYY